MKILLFALLLLPLSGLAEIYKCEDARGKVVYQDKPCQAKQLGKVETVPAPSAEDVERARRDLERMIESNRYYDKKQQAEWERKQEALRLAEMRETQEQARIAAEAEYQPRYYGPLYGPGFWPPRHPHRPHPSVPVKPRPNRPCVIGYIGDCR